MKAERQEYLLQTAEDKGNGFRQVRAYGRGKMLELRVPRTREGNFYPILMSVLRIRRRNVARLPLSCTEPA
ncbi:MAG: transposase [Lewinellaceae bacterium]|nr:transposase [Lewinellaceae bacterium]